MGVAEISAGGGVIRRVALVAAALVVLLTVIQLAVVYPSFLRGAVRDCQDEAVRDGRHISHMLPRDTTMDRLEITPPLRREIDAFIKDFHLWKLKLFSPDGRIVFSTAEGEEGGVNDHDYFYSQVAAGKVYTVPVWAKEVTLEGQVVPMDVVETYIPIMNGGRFLGACEIYYDITGRKKGIDLLVRRASLMTVGASGSFLAVLAFLAVRGERGERERKMLQEQLVRSDRMAALGTLLGGVAHEFNNINVTVMGFSQLLLEGGGLPAEERSHVERIHRAARRADTITNNLLDFSRGRAAVPARGNLAQAAREALDLVSGQYEKEGVTVRDRIEPVEDSLMQSDQMVQVALNLLTNARHAMEGRGEKVLTVETGSSGDTAFIRISDTGCGIPEEHLSQVFTPFFSTKGEHAESKEQSALKGTGLGLSVTHTIVTRHGGDMSVESRTGCGTTFTVTIPLAGSEEGGQGGGSVA